jgi:hypothetical protein
MSSRLLVVIGVLTAMLTVASAANAERRVALVVGNSAYAHASSLRNPRNDAQDITETLKRLDFEVLTGLDLDQQDFATLIQKFVRMLDDADVALFFYAGHGLQINGKNYLVSTNAKLENEFLIPAETIELDALVRLMESKAPIDLVFLDACRNNPLTDQLRRSFAAMRRGGDIGRGLARVEPTGRDTLIAFAAAPGQEAADGRDRNSPFTGALLKYMPQPGLEVSVMLKEVAADVRRETRNAQRPQQLSDMSRTFYFAKAAPAAVALAAPVPAPAAPEPKPELEVAYWNSVRSLQDCNAVQSYIRRFPNGTFIDLAKLDEQRLCVTARRITVIDATAEPQPDVMVSAAGPTATGKPSETPVAQPAAKPNAGAPVAQPIVNSNAGAPAAQPAAKPNAEVPPPLGPRQPNSVIGRLQEPRIKVQPEPPREMSMTEVIRNVQQELIRLGCGTGEADGRWTGRHREFVLRYNKYAKADLVADAPSFEMIAALKHQRDRVCPLECERGYRPSGDTCVSIKAPSRRGHGPGRGADPS